MIVATSDGVSAELPLNRTGPLLRCAVTDQQ